MNYDLAKKLKDAGFPQNPDNPALHTPGCKGWDEQPKGLVCTEESRPRVPNLSELIEACKGITVTLSQEYVANPDSGGANQEWFAGEYNFHDHEWVQVHGGKTPEEAIAELWLALNQK